MARTANVDSNIPQSVCLLNFDTSRTCRAQRIEHALAFDLLAVCSKILCREIRLKNATDLLTERSNLLAAQQELLQAKYTAILNLQLLKFYMGGDILF